MIYRVGIENKKVETNRATLLKRKRTGDDRVRFLNQFEPAPTQVNHLKPCHHEE